MKKIVILVIVGMLVLGGLGAVAVSQTTKPSLNKSATISFSHPVIQNTNGYSLVTVPQTNSWLRATGMPLLPAEVTTYTFPFGTKIQSVDVTFSNPQEFKLGNPIQATPSPVAAVDGTLITAPQQDQSIGTLYPEALFDYTMGAGVSNGEHTLFLTIRCFPVQYKPGENIVLYRGTATISVTYDLPPQTPAKTTTYQLLIIAPKKFTSALQPLVDHKISHGITTKLIAEDDICNNATEFPTHGRDCAEKMKYFIKDAYDQWGINYVLLVGGRSGGIMKEKWWLPVRYTNLDDDANWEGGFLSDLYFVDLYDAYGNFSSWDSNDNGIFAEWNNHGKDIIDMYPELSVGRLACKSVSDVKLQVSKIITYETTTAGSDWFKKIVVVGGDSAPMAGDPFFEGEQENQLAITYVPEFTPTRLWASNGNLTGPQDVTNAISAGCGLLFFDGHGNPMTWSTHPPYNESVWIDGLPIQDMTKITNGAKLPVTVCGGCHNGQFNTSLLNIVKGFLTDGFKYFAYKNSVGRFWYSEWPPACWAWKLMSMKQGGSIATMAYTGLDWFAEGDGNNDSIPDCTQFLSGYTNTQFFKNYGVNNMTILGSAHTQALTDYLNKFPPMADKLDCKTVQEFALLGDPSLQIGGYS
jgi:hypothetical protein